MFICFVSGCSEKYVGSRDGGLLGEDIVESWEKLDVKFIDQDEEGFSLNCQIIDLVEVNDSVRLSISEQQDNSIRKKRVGVYKLLGGCAIAGCATLAAFDAAYGEMVDPAGGSGYNLATCYGVVGGVGALFFIVSGILEFTKSDGAKPYYIRKRQVCIDSTPLRDEEVKIMLEKTVFEKTYYTDKNGNIELEIKDIVPEPTEADSVLRLIVQYEDMADTIDVKFRE